MWRQLDLGPSVGRRHLTLSHRQTRGAAAPVSTATRRAIPAARDIAIRSPPRIGSKRWCP